MFLATFYLLQRTPLHYAAEYDHGNVVKYLVEQKAQVNCKDKYHVCIVHVPSPASRVITHEISSNIVNIFHAVILAGYAHKAHCVVLLVTVHTLVVDISVHANLVYSFPL